MLSRVPGPGWKDEVKQEVLKLRWRGGKGPAVLQAIS